MRYLVSTLLLAATVAAGANAQAADHGSRANHDPVAHGDHPGAMHAECPLHLSNLDLTPAQQAVVDSIRATHLLAMKALMPNHEAMAAGHDMKAGSATHDMASHDMASHDMKLTDADRAAMERSMDAALALTRAVLNEAQRAKFDAAVIAHKKEMKAMQKDGNHDCMACCMECMHHGDAKKTDAVKKP